MIVVRIMDGLGNQMFQYATARRAALKLRTELKLDLSGYRSEKLRSYSLHHFQLSETLASPADTGPLFRRAALQAPLIVWDYLTAGKNGPKRPFFHEDEMRLRYDPRVLTIGDNVYLWGHWQCERYFDDISDTLRDDFTVKTPPSDANSRMADEIRSREAVCLHVRRGDYVAHWQNRQDLGVCGKDYYDRAVAEIAGKVKDPHFFVFSDDPAWCRAELKTGFPTTVVDLNGPETDYEDLRLMAGCRHFIIANSSFSWWGAWLSPNPGKLVIAPSKWFNNPARAPKDIIPERWTRI